MGRHCGISNSRTVHKYLRWVDTVTYPAHGLYTNIRDEKALYTYLTHGLFTCTIWEGTVTSPAHGLYTRIHDGKAL